jgi:hypothetical protein
MSSYTQNEDHTKRFGAVPTHKQKTAAAENDTVKSLARTEKRSAESTSRQRTKQAYSELENQRKEKRAAYKREVQNEFFH